MHEVIREGKKVANEDATNTGVSNHTVIDITTQGLSTINSKQIVISNTSLEAINPKACKEPQTKLNPKMEEEETPAEKMEIEELLKNTINHRASENIVILCLEQGKEASRLVALDCWIEEVKLKIQLWWHFEASKSWHLIIVKSKLPMEENHHGVRNILGVPENFQIPNITQMFVMDMLFWNCHRAGNNKFKRTMKEPVFMHKLDILVLMETKVELSSMGMFFNSLGFIASAHVDPVGNSGGIWMLWNSTQVNVRVSEANSEMIISSISRQNYPKWLLAAVYASPNPRTRDELWDSFEDIAHNNHMPWLLVGDFNDHIGLEKKRSFSTYQNLNQSQRHNWKFVTHFNNCNPMDLGYTDPSLTCSNNRQGWAKTLIRLDRALCNAEWRTRFPKGFACNLPRTYSNHSPMIVCTQGTLKMNIDGCYKIAKPGGFRGLIRDEKGAWICGFYGRLENCTSLETELWVMYKGLTIILQKGFNKVIIETDAEEVVKLLVELEKNIFSEASWKMQE